jgi:CRISPR-associated endonuclease/helicase Cas3
LKELQRFYGVTIVFSTATQPALGPQKSPDFNFEGIAKMVEIIKNPRALYESLKRVEVSIPTDLNKRQTWEEIAHDLNQYSSVLCVVNRRDDARQLFQLMPEGTIHLSALMCGAHRSLVIARIKEQLKQGIPTRVISTQLVEAGVDLDFPVVFRALAGLDSIAQAAGRCNREGKLKLGKVIVFVPPSEIPPGHLRQTASISRRLLAQNALDPLTPENFAQYFQELYWLKGDDLDAKRILPDLVSKDLCHINFRSAAAKFQIIDGSKYESVLVRYGEGTELIELLRKVGLERWLMRKLQRYVVNLPKYVHSRLVAAGGIHEVYSDIFIQENSNLYDAVLGFCPDKSLIYEPDDLII